MSFLRSSTAFSSLTRRAAPVGIRQCLASRNISSTPARLAQGYGDGEGDPKGENPQHQGGSNGTKHNAEHPGPEPPTAGQGTGAGPTKAGTKTPEDASAKSGGSRSKEAKETGSSPTGGEVGNSGGKSSSPTSNGASPKIHDKSQPSAANDEHQAEVEKHNREFEKGHDRAPPAAEDKVDKKFWEGEYRSG
jgi:hypothetical protein